MSTLQTFNAARRSHIVKNLTVKAEYRFEHFNLANFKTDGLDPFMASSNVNAAGTVSPSLDVFLGNWMPSMESCLKPVCEEGSVDVGRVNREGAKYTHADRTCAAGAGRWTVEMKRLLDTGSPDDKALRDRRRYAIAFAVHKNATGSRWHYVSFPYSLGMGTDAQLVARRFEGDRPNWDEIPWTTIPLFYPGQVTWQFLTGSTHAGARGVLEGQACASCHSADLMGHYAVEHELKDEIRGRWVLTLTAASVFLAGLTVAGIVVGGRRP